MIHLDFSRPILTYNLQLNCVFWWRNGYGITVSCDNHNLVWFCLVLSCTVQGRIQDFKLGGAHLKNCAERRVARKFLGYFVWKITILRQKVIFFPNFRGGGGRWIRPCGCNWFLSDPIGERILLGTSHDLCNVIGVSVEVYSTYRSNFTVGISHQCQRVYIWTDVTPSRNPVKNGTFDLRKWRTKMILYLSVSWRCIFHDLQSHYLRLQSEVFNLCTTIVRDRAIYYYRQCRRVIITWRNLHLDRLHVRLFPGRNLKWYLFRERAPSRMKHNTLHFDVDWYVFFSSLELCKGQLHTPEYFHRKKVFLD